MAVDESQAATVQVQAIGGSLADVIDGPPEVETFENAEHMTG